MKRSFFLWLVPVVLFLSGGQGRADGEGFLRVTSEPAGAMVSVGGEALGATPLLVVHAPGEFRVRAELEGHVTRDESITITENQVTRLHLVMETPRASRRPARRAERARGNLVVTSDRPDAAVFLDGRRVDAAVPLMVRDVRPGVRSVILVSGDRADHVQVTVEPGRTTELDHPFAGDRAREEPVAGETLVAEPPAEKPARPPLLELAIEKPPAPEGERAPLSAFWQEADVIELVVRYREQEEETWQVRKLASTAREGISFELPAGDYLFEVTVAHYREQRGLASLLTGSRRELIRERRESFERRLEPETGYRLVAEVGKAGELSHRFDEAPRPPEPEPPAGD